MNSCCIDPLPNLLSPLQKFIARVIPPTRPYSFLSFPFIKGSFHHSILVILHYEEGTNEF
jgi:hypothetical protein